MGVRFGDCVYRFAFPALPMVLFNHFRTVSVHTAYIPRTYSKLYKKSRVFYALSSKSQKGVASQISARASNPTVMALDAVCACAKPTSAAACSRVLPST